MAIGLCATFVALGNWQVHRLDWKRQLIHDVNVRAHAPPVAPPGPDQWRAPAPIYLRVALRGHFLAVPPVWVHGSSTLGYGDWVLSPLQTDQGFVVWVNRGYVAATFDHGSTAARAPEGEVRMVGLLRETEPGGGFLRPNHPSQELWYSRDVAAITAARALGAVPVAPYFVDAQTEGVAGGPVAGLTVIHFYNHHLNYLITWYLLALGVALATGYAVWKDFQDRRVSP